jgi:hypothetical protein
MLTTMSVCSMYLTQCETILSQIHMFSYSFKIYKIHSTFNDVVNLTKPHIHFHLQNHI